MTTYYNGEQQFNLTLGESQLRALIAEAGDHPAAQAGAAILSLHLDGPDVALLGELEDKVSEWAADGARFLDDTIRFDVGKLGWIRLTVNPDGDVDDETGRMIDCTNVTAVWQTGLQSVDFDLEESLQDEILHEWWEQERPW